MARYLLLSLLLLTLSSYGPSKKRQSNSDPDSATVGKSIVAERKVSRRRLRFQDPGENISVLNEDVRQVQQQKVASVAPYEIYSEGSETRWDSQLRPQAEREEVIREPYSVEPEHVPIAKVYPLDPIHVELKSDKLLTLTTARELLVTVVEQELERANIEKWQDSQLLGRDYNESDLKVVIDFENPLLRKVRLSAVQRIVLKKGRVTYTISSDLIKNHRESINQAKDLVAIGKGLQ